MVINITTMFLQAIIHAFVFNRMWVTENSKTHTYIYPPEEDVDVGFYSVKAFASFYLIYNGLIPLDLAVFYLLTKLIYIFRLTQDVEMMDIDKSANSGKIRGCKVKNLEIL